VALPHLVVGLVKGYRTRLLAATRIMKPSAAPRITVITPCLNSVGHIGAAIDSVSKQQGGDTVEHIVVDGGSTDGTQALLATHPHLTIIQGPDSGMYHALNKGLKHSRGSLIGFLSADDCYADGAFAALAAQFHDPTVMAVAGRALSFRETGELDRSIVREFAPAGENLLHHCTLGNPTINAWFFRPHVFQRIGRFDAAYRIAGDREFMLRLALSDLKLGAIPEVIYRYRVHADSATFGSNENIWHTVAREHVRMTHRYLAQNSLPADARRLIRRARTRDTLNAAKYSWTRRQWRYFAFYVRAGMRHDLLWPLRLFA
jgi:glycosyltransferase involved in cell wall biosynthesis